MVHASIYLSGSILLRHVDVKAVNVILPPPDEQNEIVRKVEELFHFADSIEARYQKAKAWFGKLPQAILAKAFRGELVPQDENDEPASELLKRIQQAKQNHKPSSKATLRKAQGKKTRKLYEDNDEMRLVAEE
jgi:type I restriction enzyme S subunit